MESNIEEMMGAIEVVRRPASPFSDFGAAF